MPESVLTSIGCAIKAPAGNVTFAIRQPSERRIVSGDPPLVHIFAVVFEERYTVNTVDSLES